MPANKTTIAGMARSYKTAHLWFKTNENQLLRLNRVGVGTKAYNGLVRAGTLSPTIDDEEIEN